ncbi:hypothetical protein [Marinobacter qingdaonensis]|uniref:Virulence factor lipase N-terminal n=1 Tax=Marinobacter qingdaonensis TaxID=3108486 RepID=A0ABU5NTS4_9GAMM|nr:hypothetical protein [Marinobacter sp. ASW11-75]MEA1079127.1 hypothetical protein [Marinobacter sp. ASW11-75]
MKGSESHFRLINTCHTVAIVEATEIGSKRWLQFQIKDNAGQATDNGLTGSDRPRQLPNITTQQQEKVPPMFKKTLISVAVASSLGLTGCFDSGSSGKNANPNYKISNPNFTGKTWPVFNPITSALPVPSDLQFEQGANADGTLSGSDDNAITNALDFMDGSSTTAQFDIKLSGSIDPDTVNATPVIDAGGGSPAPNPQQNVFLLSLDFPGGDPLLNNSSHYTDLIAELVENGDIPEPERSTFPGETPTFDLGIAFATAQAAPSAETVGAVFDFNNEFRAEVVSLDGGVNNTLRITPLRPLDPKKKYLVVVTDEVKDSVGQSLVGSPAYQNISNPEEPLGNAALAPVRSAIQSWEALAEGYFNALTNTSRASASLPALTADDIALSLTFTTGGTTDVLEAATSPAQFFYKNSVTTVRQEAIAKYLAANADAFEALDASTQYGTLDAVADAAIADAGDANLRASAAGTASALSGAGADFSNPEPRTIGTTFIEATRVSSATLGLPESGSVFQTSLELPYYLGIPTKTNPANLNSNWTASTTVGGLIDPSGDTPPSDKVTYRFPFAAENETMVNIPMLVSVPNPTAQVPDQPPGTTCSLAKPYDVVIYQHGIFGNRSHSLALGNQLGARCFVTVAIDLPLHGIAPKLATGDVDPSLGLSVDKTLSGGSYVDSPLPMNERHFGWAQNANGNPTRMVYSTDPEKALGSSAQFFLNLSNLPAARDNNRQGVVDLLNLNASLVNLNAIDLDNADGDSNPNTNAIADVNVQADGSGSSVYFVGHSLGGILGTSTVALVNGAAQADTIGNDNIVPFSAAAFVTPGAGIAKLLENSPSIGARVLEGLAGSGLTQGTSNLELYFNVAQASLDSAEPHNFVSSLLDSNSKVYLNEIYGDGSDRSTQDQTIPVAADTAYAGTYTRPLGDALPAPLAGTEPLIMQLEADTVSATGALSADANAVRFTAGTHTTIIRPETTTQEAVFADMAANIISFFANDGGAIQFNNAAFVKTEAPTPENP